MATTGGWRATRTWTRLLAIAFIPVVGLTAFAGFEGSERWEGVRAAEAQQSGVQRLATYTNLVNDLARETYFVTASAYGARLGVGTSVISKLLGIDVTAQLTEARNQVDQQFAKLPAGDPLLGYRSLVLSLRSRIDRHEGSPADLAFDLGSVSRNTVTATDRQLADLTKRAYGDKGSAGTERALVTLAAAHQAAEATYDELGQLAGVVFARSDASMRTMRLAVAQLDDAQAQLDLVADGSVGAAWLGLKKDAAVQANEKAFADTSTGDQASAAKLSLDQAAAVFGGGMARLGKYENLADLAATSAVGEARQQRRLSLQALWQAIGLAGSLLLLTILITVLVARSVARPLTRLREAARLVSEGNLDDVQTLDEGPYELRKVTETFEEVVTNLRTVESQVGALANGDLDDPVLAEHLPGRLGASLSDTVGRLSRAMTEQEELSTRLAYEARHDALTGLPNRAAATEEIGRALARGRRAGTPVALLYIDLDGFKHVNDNLGHGAGDTLLRGTAERLVACVREGDFAARIGGDEFLVVTEQAADAAEVVALGERIVRTLSEPHAIGRGMTRVGASIGVAIARDGETNADRMLRDADLAGYHAKASGRGRVELCDEELRAEVSRQNDIESALRDALDNDELELHFQPVVDPTGKASGAEALLRWHRPGHGIVPPNDFIPIAESSDLIIDVGRWVLQRACQHLRGWTDDEVLRDLSVSVNLSGRHLLNLTVVDDVRNALEQHGVDPSRVTIEITETTVLTDVPIVTEHLEALRAMGVRVAIDDFGTGYTSLAHLRALPVDVLKIDRSMIVNAGEAPDAHVLALLVDTAHALGLRLVAEGVETPEQLDRVQSLGCQSIQGYLFSRPLPADEFRAYLESTAAVA